MGLGLNPHNLGNGGYSGGGTGWGNLQSIVTGAHPEMGLTAEASFL